MIKVNQPSINNTAEATSEKGATKTLVGAVLGYAADGLDMLLLAFVLMFVIKEFGLTPAQAGNLTLYTTIGTLIGSYLFGFLADIYGRVSVFSFTIFLYSLATGAIYFATNYEQLAGLRFLVGMGIGGEFGIGMAIVAETWAPSLRARMTSVVALGWQSGVFAASLVAAIIVPSYGWRAVFLVGLVPAILAAYVRFGLKEPAVWTKKNTRKQILKGKEQAGTLTSEEESELKKLAGFPLWKLFVDRRTCITTIGLLIMCFIQNFGYYGVFAWMPTVLSQKYGYSLAQASGWLLISTVGMLIGIMLFGILADRIGRKKTFAMYYIGGTIYCILYFFVFNSPALLLWGGALLGFFVNGMMGGYGAILAENYPAEARATAENIIFGTGRGLAGFGPALIGILATGGNIMGAMSLVFLIYPIGLIAMLTMVPETKGVRLD